jgi:hypothetical protein
LLSLARIEKLRMLLGTPILTRVISVSIWFMLVMNSLGSC